MVLLATRLLVSVRRGPAVAVWERECWAQTPLALCMGWHMFPGMQAHKLALMPRQRGGHRDPAWVPPISESDSIWAQEYSLPALPRLAPGTGFMGGWRAAGTALGNSEPGLLGHRGEREGEAVRYCGYSTLPTLLAPLHLEMEPRQSPAAYDPAPAPHSTAPANAGSYCAGRGVCGGVQTLLTPNPPGLSPV